MGSDPPLQDPQSITLIYLGSRDFLAVYVHSSQFCFVTMEDLPCHHENDFVNAESHARKKALFAEYGRPR